MLPIIDGRMDTQTLLAEIENFLVRHQMSATRFGLETVNDGHLLRRLRDTEVKKPRDVTLTTANKLRQFMADRDAQRAAA